MEDSSFISGDCDTVSFKNNKETSCGIGNCHPKCLQWCAQPRYFLVFFSLIGILQGAYFTYFIGILSTLEKRYSFDSWITGIILIADNLSPALFGILVGYYGKYVHKPRLVTFGMMITVFSCFLSSLPYFLFGPNDKSFRSFSSDNLLCDRDEKNEMCSQLSQNVTAIVILFLANFLNGFGSMAYYTVGFPYIDDSVKRKNSPLYIGTNFSLRIVGPTLGFMLSSLCLKYYEDPIFDPGFDGSDPRWVGAWWIGFLVLGFVIFLASLPLAFFPKHLAYNTTSDEDNTVFKSSLSELFLALKKLVKNPILMLHTMSITFQINGLFGYLVFMPKYMESQYRKTASSASFYSGNVTLVAMAIGVFLGGFCIHKLKPKARFLVGYMLFVEIFAGVALLIAFFMGCDSPNHHENVASLVSLESKSCNLNCTCDRHIFNPVCDINNGIHFSPCSAGCYNYTVLANGKMGFHNCSCISPQSHEITVYDAIKGFCSKECAMFLPYVIIVTLAKMFSATARVGNTLISLRCVDEKDKTLALGAVEFIISIFATIPFPLFYGYIINKACILWDKTCEYQGNCWLYDSTLFRHYLHSVSVGFIVLAICCDFGVLLMSSKMKDLYGKREKHVNSIELDAVNS